MGSSSTRQHVRSPLHVAPSRRHPDRGSPAQPEVFLGAKTHSVMRGCPSHQIRLAKTTSGKTMKTPAQTGYIKSYCPEVCVWGDGRHSGTADRKKNFSLNRNLFTQPGVKLVAVAAGCEVVLLSWSVRECKSKPSCAGSTSCGSDKKVVPAV